MARTPDDRLRRLASHYEAEVGRARADRLAASVLLRVRPHFASRRRSWQVAVASAAVALAGFAGLGALADQAIPGQVLYPVDRAYESVAGFIGGSEDRSEERLIEALELIDRGRQTEAVDLIDEAIDQLARRPELQIALVDSRASATSTIVTSPTPSSTPAQTPATTAPAPIDETPASPPVVIAAADASTSLRVATEFLLRTVRDAKDQAGDAALTDDVSRAASELLAAAQVVKETPVTIPAVAVPETTTTVVSSTTSTSEPTPESPSSTSSTTTTEAGATATTTTTVTGSTTTTTQPGNDDGGPGPIIIPPQP